MSPRMLAAILAVLVLLIIFPLFLLILATRPFRRLALATRYRFKVRGCEHIPKDGPVLIVSNHMTWLDGAFVMAVCPRRPLFLVNAAYIDWPIIRSIARRLGLIPVPATGPRGQRAAIASARSASSRRSDRHFSRGATVSQRSHRPVSPRLGSDRSRRGKRLGRADVSRRSLGKHLQFLQRSNASETAERISSRRRRRLRSADRAADLGLSSPPRSSRGRRPRLRTPRKVASAGNARSPSP